MAIQPDRLWELLPVVVREHDVAEGYPLRALLRIVAAQHDLVESDIAGPVGRPLHRDLPSVGDSLHRRSGRQPAALRPQPLADARSAAELFGDLNGPDLRPPIAVRTRADVAKTIYYRRRKGTLPMLEELARDVTGWPAHAVEFFELLGWTQHLEHIRPQSAWADVRRVDRMDRIDGAFDEASHTVDVRTITASTRAGTTSLTSASSSGGCSATRSRACPPARPASRGAFTSARSATAPRCSAAGAARATRAAWRPSCTCPARSAARSSTRISTASRTIPPRPTSPISTACRPRRRPAEAQLNPTLPITPAQTERPARRVPAADRLSRSSTPGRRRSRPAASSPSTSRAAARDRRRLGRRDGPLDVYYHYGFSADLGGGAVRAAEVARAQHARGAPPLRAGQRRAGDARHVPDRSPPRSPTGDGLRSRRHGHHDPRQPHLRRSGTRPRFATTAFLAIQAANGRAAAADDAGRRPQFDVSPPAVAGDRDRRGALTLCGVRLEGPLHVMGDLGRLRLLHATLVPGRRLTDGRRSGRRPAPSIAVDAGARGRPDQHAAPGGDRVQHHRRLEVPENARGIWLARQHRRRARGDGRRHRRRRRPRRAAALTIERSTAFGRMRVRSLDASESIFTGRVDTLRRRHGCVRFSYVPPGSRTPRRYRCQPDLAVRARARGRARAHDPALSAADQDAVRASVAARLQPAFTPTATGSRRTRSCGAATPGRDPHRRRRRRGDGRLLPAQAAAAREQPADPPRGVPAVRPRRRTIYVT